MTLPGIDTSALTTREKSEWSSYVTEFLTPCADQPVSLAQCVKEARPCKACRPAAEFLLAQARRGRVRAQVEGAYKARFSPEAVRSVDLAGAPSKGASEGKVVIAEFADFECPACGAARTVLDDLVKKYPNDVKLYFKHFPLTMHPHAEKAARASVAALRQGKFWDMHATLFEHQTALEPENIERLAKEIGLDLKRFREDRDSESAADAVSRDRKQGEALQLKSTPSLFINGRPFPPTSEFSEELEEWVKSEIEIVGKSPEAAKTTEPAKAEGLKADPGKTEPSKSEPAKAPSSKGVESKPSEKSPVAPKSDPKPAAGNP
ncbi:MAG TPA: thioredoxin domain-containing protein [Polyangiaceae bacterium]|nr:thioredoxin domain-containing protein [Polyangiaceae bacterium]